MRIFQTAFCCAAIEFLKIGVRRGGKKGRKTHKSHTCPQGTYSLRADICTSSPCNIWDVASPIWSLLLLTCSVPCLLSLYLKEAPMSAFRWLQMLRAGLFRWLPRTFLFKKSKHTVLISANELFISGFKTLDGISNYAYSETCLMNTVCKLMLVSMFVFLKLYYARHTQSTANSILQVGTKYPDNVNHHLADNGA